MSLTPKEFLKSGLSKKSKDVAFTYQESKLIEMWMRQYARYMVKQELKRQKCS